MESNVDLERLGKEPIHPDQPAGKDIRYDPGFEELQAEVGKLSSPSAGAMDWEKVVRLSQDILGQKSKDLLVASYLAVGLIYTRKIEGFAIGLRIYLDLLETFWEGFYPAKNRMRARLSAVEWWLEKAGIALQQLEGISLSQGQLNLLKEHLEKIDQLFHQNLEEPPSLLVLWDRVESFSPPPELISQPEKPQETAPPPPIERAVKKEKEPEVSEAIASTNDAQRVLNFGLQKIREVTAYLWQEDLSNPLPYRWSRIAAWSIVEALPPSTNGQTRIPVPAVQIRNLLDDLKRKGDPEGLLRSAEARVPQFIFWIDLNHWITEALAQLGDRFQRAKGAVQQETAYLIYRLPGVEDLCFADGTPFADSETKNWLKEIAFRSGSVVEGSVPIPESGPRGQDEDVIGKEVKEAQILIKKGNLLEALDGLQQRFHHSLSQKEKLLWRLALSQLLVENKQSKLAIPHLEQMIKDIDFYRLEEFDPELALRCLKVIWFGLHPQSDQTWKDKANEVLHRVAKLDLAEAIRMGKS